MQEITHHLEKNYLFRRLFFVMVISLMISGCATGLKKEVRQLEADIEQDRQAISTAKTWLSDNSDVYNGSTCSTPEQGARPQFSCETKEEARETGLALCAASYKGCAVVVAALGNQLNGWDERFLASEACEQLLARYTGETRSSLATVADGTLEYAKDRCQNGGFWGKLLTCPIALVGETIKFAQFADCANRKSQECYSNYDNWVYGPSRRKAQCEENLALIDRTQRSLSYNSSVLRKKKDTFMWKVFGDH